MLTLREQLPPVPPAGYGDGYDWMESLFRTPWRPVGGTATHLYGDWPYVIVAYANVAATDDDDILMAPVYGLAVYQEGTVTATAFASRQARTQYVLKFHAIEDTEDDEQ